MSALFLDIVQLGHVSLCFGCVVITSAQGCFLHHCMNLQSSSHVLFAGINMRVCIGSAIGQNRGLDQLSWPRKIIETNNTYIVYNLIQPSYDAHVYPYFMSLHRGLQQAY